MRNVYASITMWIINAFFFVLIDDEVDSIDIMGNIELDSVISIGNEG